MRHITAFLSVISVVFTILCFASTARAAEIFNSGFEGCTNGATCAVGGWDSETDTGSDMAASTSVQRSGSCSCQFTVNDTTTEYITEGGSISTESEIWMLFWFRVNDGGEYIDANTFGFVNMRNEADTAATFICRFRQDGGQTWSIGCEAGVDGGTTTQIGDTPRGIVANRWYPLKIHFKAATGAGNNDGIFTWWLNGYTEGHSASLDSDTVNAGILYLGGQFGLDAGSPNITISLDDFIIRDDSTDPGYGSGGMPPRNQVMMISPIQ